MRTTTKALLLLVVGTVAPRLARAQVEPLDEAANLDHSGTPAAPAEELPPPSAQLGAKRPVPSYDGRPAAAPDLAETLVWVPRVVLFPVHAVTEYGVRRPMVGMLTWSEEHFLVARLRRVFTTDDGKTGGYPYFLVDAGLRPRVGAIVFSEGFLHPDNDLRLTGSIARTSTWAVMAQNRTRLLRNRGADLVLRAASATADDHRFYGIGPLHEEHGAAFAMRRIDGSATLEGGLRGRSHAAVNLRVRDMSFDGSRFGGSADDLAATHGGLGQPALPPGWAGYWLAGVGGRVALDSRSHEPHTEGGTGVRLELDGALSAGSDDLRFGEWGGELAGFYDVTHRENVFGVRVAARFQENAGGAPIPFTEQVTLGGNETMRGFLTGRMRGNSSFLAEVQYRYAIWALADAELFSSVGNTFEGHLEGLRPGALYWTSGLSLRTTLSRDSAWAAGVAIGSNRLDDPRFNVANHVRLFAGLNQGF